MPYCLLAAWIECPIFYFFLYGKARGPPLKICKERTQGTELYRGDQDVQYETVSRSIVLISFPETLDSDWALQ